jgi:hypothetical protein
MGIISIPAGFTKLEKKHGHAKSIGKFKFKENLGVYILQVKKM